MRPRPSKPTAALTRKSTRASKKGAQAVEREAQASFLRLVATLSTLDGCNPYAPVLSSLSHDCRSAGATDILVRHPAGTKQVAVSTLWKDLALRHKRLRTTSESENSRLRELVEEQRRTISSIRALMQRQAHQNELHDLAAKPVSAIDTSIVQADTNILHQLRLEIESSSFTASLPSIPPGGASLGILPPQIRQISGSKWSLVFSASRAMPFDFQDIAALICSQDHLKDVSTDESSVNGTSTRNYCVQHAVDREHFTMCGSNAFRKYEASRAGIFRRVAASGNTVAGITMRERGRTSISRATSNSCGHLAQFQMILEVVIEVDGMLALPAAHLNAVIHILSRTNPEYVGQELESIENILLRQHHTL